MADAGSDDRLETETLAENIVSSNVSKVISHYLQSPERQGSYVIGYVDGKARLDAFLEDFDRAGCTGFPLRSSNSRAKYGSRPKPVLDSGGRLPRYAGEERIVWSSNSGKVPIPDTATPFIMSGTRHHHCMFISDKKKPQLNKRSGTDSFGRSMCKAEIHVREIRLFLGYSATEYGPSNQKASLRKRRVNRLTADLRCGKALPPVTRYHIRVPLPEAHSDHPLGKAAGCFQKVHPALISKMGQLVQAGISDFPNVQQYLRACTEELLENAVVRPFPTDRRYHPLMKDIQNHVWRFKFKLKEDQARIIDLEEHDYLGSMEDFPIPDPSDSVTLSSMTTQAIVGGGLHTSLCGYDNEIDDLSDDESCSRPNISSSFLQQHTIQTGNPVAIDCVLGDGSTIPYMLTPVEMVSVGSETEISTAGVQRHLGATPMLSNSFLDEDAEYWQKAAMAEIERLQALTSLCTNAAKLKEVSEKVNHMWLSLKKEILPDD
ncbi:Hypp7816 [Branchiostoma lanceolatum]|uniref:Hypp7816 protein n=1 Tax=Branchiostoma lanceolatum TaxID=7740 RepID=A0A8J9Z3L4_BRALA|nr:Hypp7816 [Branchiostoma lanceolatum]